MALRRTAVAGCWAGARQLGAVVIRALSVGARGGRATPAAPGPRTPAESLGTGVAVRGRVWPGADSAVLADGVVVVDQRGVVVAMGAFGSIPLPAGVRLIGGPGAWVGPGLIDAHVHLAFGSPEQQLRGALVGVRDLGAPPGLAAARTGRARPPAGSPTVRGCGPILTAPDGYPSRSWGADGFACFVDSEPAARLVVGQLAGDGVDLIKIALEPAGGPVPPLVVVRAVVQAAHDVGLPVTAHALNRAMVSLALDAGVDELAHTPTQPLGDALVGRIAQAGIAVVSTLQTFFQQGDGPAAAGNAASLHAAGVPLLYGTDLGNEGTRSGVDPRELDRLADAGLGRLGALRAATVGSAGAAGMSGPSGRVTVGEPAALVLLGDDPLSDPLAWRIPHAVITDGRLLQLETGPAARDAGGREAQPASWG